MKKDSWRPKVSLSLGGGDSTGGELGFEPRSRHVD